MLEIILKVLFFFFIGYVIWLFTGGVERGEQRAAEENSSLFIGTEGTALDAPGVASTSGLIY